MVGQLHRTRKDTLQWKYGRDAVEQAARRRSRSVHLAWRSLSMGHFNVTTHGVPYTRAARAHAFKPEKPPSYVDICKIPRFAAIGDYAVNAAPREKEGSCGEFAVSGG
jgi:hypothetical protein